MILSLKSEFVIEQFREAFLNWRYLYNNADFYVENIAYFHWSKLLALTKHDFLHL